MKNLKKIIIIFLLLFMTGCYQQESTIKINADKSMDLDIKILTKRSLDESLYSDNREAYEKRNISINKIKENEYSGYKITKKYDNIDNYSIESDVKVDINKYLDKDFDDKTLFKVEKGFLKNKYTIDFVYKHDEEKEIYDIESVESFVDKIKTIYDKATEEYELSNKRISLNNENSGLEFDSYIKYNILIDAEGNVILLDVSDGYYSYKKESVENIVFDDIDIDEINAVNKEISNIVFNIILPASAISHNASNASSNGKELTWNYNNNELNINLVFEIANKSNYYLLFGVVVLSVLLLFILVIMVVKIKNLKKAKIESSTPIHTDYDPSIKDIALNEKSNVIPNEDEPIQEIDDTEEIKEDNPLKPSKEVEEELIDMINTIEKKEDIIEIKE